MTRSVHTKLLVVAALLVGSIGCVNYVPCNSAGAPACGNNQSCNQTTGRCENLDGGSGGGIDLILGDDRIPPSDRPVDPPPPADGSLPMPSIQQGIGTVGPAPAGSKIRVRDDGLEFLDRVCGGPPIICATGGITP